MLNQNHTIGTWPDESFPLDHPQILALRVKFMSDKAFSSSKIVTFKPKKDLYLEHFQKEILFQNF